MLTKLGKIFAFLLICSMAHAQSTKLNPGTYQGKLDIEGELHQVITNFEIVNNKITGEYNYDNTHGSLVNCELDGNKLFCEFKDPERERGILISIFNTNFTEFIGTWYYINSADENYGGSWTGKTKKK